MKPLSHCFPNDSVRNNISHYFSKMPFTARRELLTFIESVIPNFAKEYVLNLTSFQQLVLSLLFSLTERPKVIVICSDWLSAQSYSDVSLLFAIIRQVQEQLEVYFIFEGAARGLYENYFTKYSRLSSNLVILEEHNEKIYIKEINGKAQDRPIYALYRVSNSDELCYSKIADTDEEFNQIVDNFEQDEIQYYKFFKP